MANFLDFYDGFYKQLFLPPPQKKEALHGTVNQRVWFECESSAHLVYGHGKVTVISPQCRIVVREKCGKKCEAFCTLKLC